MQPQIPSIRTKVLYISGAVLAVVLFKVLMAASPGFRAFYLFGFYPFFTRTWRLLSAWCPFSLGDLLYVLAAIWLVTGLVRFISRLVHFRSQKKAAGRQLLRFCFILVVFYGVFLVFWGVNYRYNRLEDVFGITPGQYPDSTLVALCDSLAGRLNTDHRRIAGSDTAATSGFLSFAEIKARVPANYERISMIYPRLRYRHPSLKPSMFGYLMNYAGITGYFNPFTGEAQVNTTPMPVSLPFTACHEVAHQLGFAAEDDANFVGYLVAATSPDIHFRYAADFEMFLYGINVVSFRDPELADSLWHQLITPGVRADYDSDFAFYERFRTSIRPVLNDFYDQYLKANEQKRGIRSYNDVISILIDYIRVHGRLPEIASLPGPDPGRSRAGTSATGSIVRAATTGGTRPADLPAAVPR